MSDNNSSMLVLRNVKRHYTQGGHDLEILRDVNLEVNKGETVGLIGASGSGKSTLLQIIGLLDQGGEGEIFIDNQFMGSLSDQEKTKIRLNDIGFIYQFHHLLPEFTALENVYLPQLVLGMKKAEAKSRAEQLLSNLGLASRLEHKPSELSGGEQQRVAIARALVNKPRLLLADEPTGSLDEETGLKVMDEFLNLAQSEGITTVIATHNPAFAEKLERCVYLHNGLVQSQLNKVK